MKAGNSLHSMLRESLDRGLHIDSPSIGSRSIADNCTHPRLSAIIISPHSMLHIHSESLNIQSRSVRRIAKPYPHSRIECPETLFQRSAGARIAHRENRVLRTRKTLRYPAHNIRGWVVAKLQTLARREGLKSGQKNHKIIIHQMPEEVAGLVKKRACGHSQIHGCIERRTGTRAGFVTQAPL